MNKTFYHKRITTPKNRGAESFYRMTEEQTINIKLTLNEIKT